MRNICVQATQDLKTLYNRLFLFYKLRNCFEFLQKVFLVLMFPFSCVLWAIFCPFRFCSLSDSPLSSSSHKRKCLKKLIPNHRTINSKQFLIRQALPLFAYFVDVIIAETMCTSSLQKRCGMCANSYTYDISIKF